MRNFYPVIFLASFLTATLSLKAQSPVAINIDLGRKAQTIKNFGASGCWFSDPIGNYWPDSTKKRMAELLFSKETYRDGSPKGIGLSAWRFNIGAGTAEQGDSSGIKDSNHRVECFLNADGSYSWNKEQGYLWFTKQARQYRVENLIAFVNSPPVFYTQNGLGYKTQKDAHTNLKADKYDAYAGFLAEVLAHFERENIHFNYISPVNEPQWDWYDKFGQAKQEGSPYTNEEIYHVATTLDKALDRKGLSAQILIPEAGMLTYLYSSPANSPTGSQVQQFWKPGSPYYLGDLKHLAKFVAGHGYFTDGPNSAAIRQKVGDTAKKYGVEYWQSEYCMLGEGFKEGSKDKRTGFDCALFLAKLIHHDLVEGNASAWQFWNSWEPGRADYNTLYYLLALHPSADFRAGSFEITKNLWALGQFSRFIRPGMARISLDPVADKDLLISAYYGGKHLTVVMINNCTDTRTLQLNLPAHKFNKNYDCYITTANNGDNMKRSSGTTKKVISMQPRSVYTLVVKETVN